jgi:hypothetical protein
MQYDAGAAFVRFSPIDFQEFFQFSLILQRHAILLSPTHPPTLLFLLPALLQLLSSLSSF